MCCSYKGAAGIDMFFVGQYVLCGGGGVVKQTP
jgi:hypothetical protein